MAENNKCNAEQYEMISKHIAALLWLNDNGGWESISKRLMPESFSWPRFEDNSPVMIGDKFIDCMGYVDRVVYISFDPDYCSIHGENGASTFHMNESIKRPNIVGNDCKYILVGETVYGQDAKAWKVIGFNYNSQHSVIGMNDNSVRDLRPEWLSHEKHMTIDDIEAYIESNAEDYLQPHGNGMYENTKMVPMDVVDNAMYMLKEFYKRT